MATLAFLQYGMLITMENRRKISFSPLSSITSPATLLQPVSIYDLLQRLSGGPVGS
jgi:hypothetical protein